MQNLTAQNQQQNQFFSVTFDVPAQFVFCGRRSVRLPFVEEIGNRIFRFTSGSWPAQKTKLRDGSAGRCVLWEQGRALATGQRIFRGHHFKQSNSVRPLQNRLSW